jgi:hypothetical protein
MIERPVKDEPPMAAKYWVKIARVELNYPQDALNFGFSRSF